MTNNANITENTLSFLCRPIRVINKYQAVVYRRYVTQGPQASGISYGNYFSDTTGGKYGVFAYDMPNARASEGFYIRATNPDTNPPYAPVTYNAKVGGLHVPLPMANNEN